MPETWASVGGVRPRAGINSALPRLTARPRGAPGSREGARGKKKKKSWGALWDSAPAGLFICCLLLLFFIFSPTGRNRGGGGRGKPRAQLFPALSPQRRGDAGSRREVAACGKGGERRVSPRRALRQPPSSGAPSPAARSPAPAPAAPRRQRKGGREAAQPSGPGCSFASSPLPCSSSTAWITATAKPAAGDAAREVSGGSRRRHPGQVSPAPGGR